MNSPSNASQRGDGFMAATSGSEGSAALGHIETAKRWRRVLDLIDPTRTLQYAVAMAGFRQDMDAAIQLWEREAAAEQAPGHTDLMVAPESIAPWLARDAAARTICDFMGWPEDGPAFDDAIKLAERLGFKLLTENPTHILLHALRELLATCDSDDEAFRDSGKRLAAAAITKALAHRVAPMRRPRRQTPGQTND